MSRTFTARWVFPVSGPPLPNGTITIDGDRITAVEPRGTRTPDEDLGNVALVPGLVNPHTHLDLSGARGLIPPTDPDHFTDWLRGVISYRRSRTAEQTQADIRAGLAEALRFGTTLVGDIASEGASYPVVSQAPIRAVLFWEIIGLALERCTAASDQRDRKTGLGWDVEPEEVVYSPTTSVRWAISPHAPYSVNHKYALGSLVGTAGAKAIHLAESPDELELLDRGTGRFVPFLKQLGVWHDGAFGCRANDFLRVSPQNMSPRLYIHCNYLRPDVALRENQSVVYCPRTHAAFGHPPHPFRDFLSRGVRVCLGTDSLASNPDLDILAEARFVRSRYPDFPGDQLLRMITLAGAEALGWADECGSLEAGKSADFVAVPLPNTDALDPHELLLAQHEGERRTMFRGQWRNTP